jgi:hypothetical protein
MKGDADALMYIEAANFDFQILFPCPYIKGDTCEEGWYNWCCTHWGTKWKARDVLVERDEHGGLCARFRTAWGAPHGVLAYLSYRNPNLFITNEWYDDCNEVLGVTVYTNGSFESKSFEPNTYSLAALKEFAEENEWFDYDDYEYSYLRQMEDIENREAWESALLPRVNIRKRTSTFQEYLASMEQMFKN